MHSESRNRVRPNSRLHRRGYLRCKAQGAGGGGTGAIAQSTINLYSKIVIKVNGFLYKIFEPVLAKIRRYIPNISGIDISVIVLFLLIHFSKDVLYTYFYVF